MYNFINLMLEISGQEKIMTWAGNKPKGASPCGLKKNDFS
jgi:hypothetical protein